VSSAYSAEFSLIRSVLFNYPLGTQPVPATPPGLIDATALPIPLTANTTGLSTGGVINAEGVEYTLLAADPFVMEYTDGLPLSEVGWGQLSLDQLSQQTRIITLDFALETSPYLNKVQSSNAAAHILASIQQEIFGQTIPGAFSAPGTRVIVINSSDLYVVGLAGLLNMHWQLPGYQPDYAAPGGSLVFELRQHRSTGQYIVRVYYTAQTFDQLRNLTPLTLDQPPATQQLLIPGISSNSLDVDAFKFSDFLLNTIDYNDVQNPITETPPGPLTGVPLQ
jgi:4-phytase/acid phosphatase